MLRDWEVWVAGAPVIVPHPPGLPFFLVWKNLWMLSSGSQDLSSWDEPLPVDKEEPLLSTRLHIQNLLFP
ncbi:hypothetical protein GDO81_021931 [Engystomops pustulosus]|uniref:Uncharacterized protein n=1 Tax=Engystomops pustulosus TaxID=76066 RepID=A0AAV6ZSI1_ENGPU|nr:hypothetical protein GDO81_021931 [Engystomops pustulosus]